MMSNSHVLSEKSIKNAQILFTSGEHGCEVNDYKRANYYDRKFAVSPERILSSSPSQPSENKSDKNHLDYSLFTLDENVFKNGYLDQYGYLEIDPNGAMVGDAIHIPQHGVYKNRTEKTIAYYETSTLIDNKLNHVRDIKTDSFVKGVHGAKIDYHTDTEPGASGSPVINNDNNKVIAMHYAHSTSKSENLGVNMKYIWPHIKDYYLDSLKEKDNMINHFA